MSNYALYHSMDLDGWSCGMILKRAGYQVIPYTYGDPLPVPLSEIAVIADVSLPASQMCSWSNAVENALWFDHHAPIIKEVTCNSAWKGTLIRSSLGCCESVLAHFPLKDVYGNISLAARYDVWDFSYPGDMVPLYHQFGWRAKVTFGDIDATHWFVDPYHYIQDGVVIAKYLQKQADYAASRAVERTLGLAEHPVKVIMGPATNPMITLTHKGIFVFVTMRKSGWAYSLRSSNDNDVDLGELAKSFGGGGHAHAAGFWREGFIFT